MKVLKGSRRKMELALLVALAGSMMQNGTLSCVQGAGNAATAAVDFCFLFNCNDGFFGGLAQPCDAGFSLFVDCEELSQPFLFQLYGETAVPDNFGGFRPPGE